MKVYVLSISGYRGARYACGTKDGVLSIVQKRLKEYYDIAFLKELTYYQVAWNDLDALITTWHRFAKYPEVVFRYEELELSDPEKEPSPWSTS